MSRIIQSTVNNIMIKMTLASDHVTGAAGKTLSCSLSKNGGDFIAITPAIVERGNGYYSVELVASDTDTIGEIIVRATAVDCDDGEWRSQVVLEPATESTLNRRAIEARRLALLNEVIHLWRFGNNYFTASYSGDIKGDAVIEIYRDWFGVDSAQLDIIYNTDTLIGTISAGGVYTPNASFVIGTEEKMIPSIRFLANTGSIAPGTFTIKWSGVDSAGTTQDLSASATSDMLITSGMVLNHNYITPNGTFKKYTTNLHNNNDSWHSIDDSSGLLNLYTRSSIDHSTGVINPVSEAIYIDRTKLLLNQDLDLSNYIDTTYNSKDLQSVLNGNPNGLGLGKWYSIKVEDHFDEDEIMGYRLDGSLIDVLVSCWNPINGGNVIKKYTIDVDAEEITASTTTPTGFVSGEFSAGRTYNFNYGNRWSILSNNGEFLILYTSNDANFSTWTRTVTTIPSADFLNAHQISNNSPVIIVLHRDTVNNRINYQYISMVDGSVYAGSSGYVDFTTITTNRTVSEIRFFSMCKDLETANNAKMVIDVSTTSSTRKLLYCNASFDPTTYATSITLVVESPDFAYGNEFAGNYMWNYDSMTINGMYCPHTNSYDYIMAITCLSAGDVYGSFYVSMNRAIAMGGGLNIGAGGPFPNDSGYWRRVYQNNRSKGVETPLILRESNQELIMIGLNYSTDNAFSFEHIGPANNFIADDLTTTLEYYSASRVMNVFFKSILTNKPDSRFIQSFTYRNHNGAYQPETGSIVPIFKRRQTTSSGGGATTSEIWGYATRTLTSAQGASLAEIEGSTVLAKAAAVAAIPTNPLLANDPRISNISAYASANLFSYRGSANNIFSIVMGSFVGKVNFYTISTENYILNPVNPPQVGGVLSNKICTLNSNNTVTDSVNLSVSGDLLFLTLEGFEALTDVILNIYTDSFGSNTRIYIPKGFVTVSTNEPYYPTQYGTLLRQVNQTADFVSNVTENYVNKTVERMEEVPWDRLYSPIVIESSSTTISSGSLYRLNIVRGRDVQITFILDKDVTGDTFLFAAKNDRKKDSYAIDPIELTIDDATTGKITLDIPYTATEDLDSSGKYYAELYRNTSAGKKYTVKMFELELQRPVISTYDV